MSHSMSRFFGTVEKLISGLRSGELTLDTAQESLDSRQLAATTMLEGLHKIGRMLSQSELRGAALCSQIWDTILVDCEQALQTYFSHDDVCLSYWLWQPEFLLGHYTAVAKDRLGDSVFNKLPLVGDSPVAQSFRSRNSNCVSDTHKSPLISPELARHVGSLLAWPVCVSSREVSDISAVAVLLVESRRPGAVGDHREILFLIEALSSLFEISYHATTIGHSVVEGLAPDNQVSADDFGDVLKKHRPIGSKVSSE